MWIDPGDVWAAWCGGELDRWSGPDARAFVYPPSESDEDGDEDVESDKRAGKTRAEDAGAGRALEAWTMWTLGGGCARVALSSPSLPSSPVSLSEHPSHNESKSKSMRAARRHPDRKVLHAPQPASPNLVVLAHDKHAEQLRALVGPAMRNVVRKRVVMGWRGGELFVFPFTCAIIDVLFSFLL